MINHILGDCKMADDNNKGIIDLNEIHEASILSGILGISIPMVYEGRKTGKLPAKVEASYRECIQHYITFYKNQVSKKSSSMYEAKLEQDVRNGIAKEQMQWLEIKKQKEELIEITQVNELFFPIFHIVKATLVNITRKFPETTIDIDRVLESWHALGTKIGAKASLDSKEYVQAQLDKPVELSTDDDGLSVSGTLVDEALNSFGVE